MSESDADIADSDETVVPAPPPPDDGSIGASVARLVASGKELAEAELAWAKLKGALIAEGLRKWLVFASLALIFLVMGVVILIVSAIIALTPYVGLLYASLIVAGIAVFGAAICALAARRTFMALFEENKP
jgi:uncharacterized membrane protein YqjE